MMYSIGETAEIIGLNATTLRYYDKEGLLPFVDRSSKGIRLFKEEDFEWLRLIEYLKATGMPIKDIRKFISLYTDGDTTLEERRQMFYERKAAIEKQLEETQKMLDIVTYKCWFYDEACKRGSAADVKCIADEKLPENIKNGRRELAGWKSSRG